MPEPAFLVGVIIAGTLTLYVLLGGADYGGGVWDLLARGSTSERERTTIARAIAPVWEANHVWLILAITVLFTAFPPAYALIGTVLHIPLVIGLLGIVLRGSAFVFRTYGPEERLYQRRWGLVFAGSSTVTPLVLGITVAAISEGRLPASADGSFTDVFVWPWITPFTITVAAFALLLFAYLAAVYLTLEAPDDEVREVFRRRALATGLLVGAVALLTFLLSPEPLQTALTRSGWAIPLHTATAVCAIAALLALSARQFWWARAAAAAQVALIVWGWALAQYPFLVRPHLTLWNDAAPASVLVLLLQVLAVGTVVLVPALVYLFRTFGPRDAGPTHS